MCACVRVCVRARTLFWHEPALTVAINEQTVRVGPGTRKIVRERRQACEMDPQPTVTVLITTEQIMVSPAPPPARGVPRVLETGQGPPPGSRPETALAHPRGGSGQGASRAARPGGGTDVARWRRGRPERTHPRPGMMWPRGPGRPAAKSTRGCTVQLSSLRLEMMTRLRAPGTRVAGRRGCPPPRRASPGPVP